MNGLRLHHVALWVDDLEAMRAFYVDMLGAGSGPRYENPNTGLRSYFIAFADGARLELMFKPGRHRSEHAAQAPGYAHIALSVGGRQAVDEQVSRLRDRGVRVVSEPRTTGDGYYEAVIEDPEGNRIELVE